MKNNNNDEKEDKIYNKAITILSILTLVGLCYLGYMFYNDYQENIASYEEQINKLHSTISSKTQELNKYKEKIAEFNKQIKFMDDHVAICPNDGSGLYHKYGCEHLDTSSFMIYNTEQAPNEGYSPCFYCSELSNTYSSWDAYKEEREKTEIVYVTDTGSKYHRSGCSYLKSKNAITKDKAINQGYSACSRCNP